MILLCSLFLTVNAAILYMACSEVAFSIYDSLKVKAIEAKNRPLIDPRLKKKIRRKFALFYLSVSIRYILAKKALARIVRQIFPSKGRIYVLNEQGLRIKKIETTKCILTENAAFLYTYLTRLSINPDCCVEIVHSDEDGLGYKKILFPNDVVSWPLENNISKSETRLLYAFLETTESTKEDVTDLLKPWFYETPDLRVLMNVKAIQNDVRRKGFHGGTIELLFSDLSHEKIFISFVT